MKLALEGFRARAREVREAGGVLSGTSDRRWTYLTAPLPAAPNEALHFAAVPLGLVDSLTAHRTLRWRRDARSFSLPLKVELAPGPFEATPLSLDDAEQIDAHWEHRDDVSLRYIRECIARDPAFGVRVGGVLLGWELIHDDGAMGAAFVRPQFRRQGVMRSLQFAMVKALRERRLPVFKHISLDNTGWLSAQERAGWVNEGDHAWFELEPLRVDGAASELEALLQRELAKLQAFTHALAERNEGPSRHAREEATRAAALLNALRECQALQLPAEAAYAFRRSVSARTSLLRHTPALEGAPGSLDPRQATGGTHLVDYARGGYFLFADDTQPEHVRFDDHPRLAELARSCSKTLGRGLEHSLLFTSGMGALNTVMDLVARQPGRALLGASSWIEAQEYADATWPSRFERVDETDTKALCEALADPAVGALFIEPLVNHPRAPVVELTELLAAPVAGPKTLVLDVALTPELDLSRTLSALPEGLKLILISSGVKFFQAGWDLSKSGLVELAGDASLYRELIKLRGRSGRVLSAEEAELADLETTETLRARARRLDERTRRLAVLLEPMLPAGAVVSPWLDSHPHHARAMRLGTGGRFLYLDVKSPRLETLDRDLAREAKARGVPLITATTFGLALPHVCLLAHPSEGFRLRLSPGSIELPLEPLAELIIDLCSRG